MMRHESINSYSISRAIALLSLLLLAACGDPAPGEGVEKAHEQSAMPEVVSAREAVRSTDIAEIDLQTMEEAEFEKVITAGSRCSFAYTSESSPVLAVGIKPRSGAEGAVKIHGKLVQVVAPQVKTFKSLSQGATFTADGLRVKVMPERQEAVGERQPRSADVVFELEQGLKVGYRGWYTCRKEEVPDHSGN